MKPSGYNFIWPTENPGKVMVFNSLTTALAEVEKRQAALLDVRQFDYDALAEDERRFVDELRPGGFVLDDTVDEFKILKFAYNSVKYNWQGLGLTIAPTLRCNFACTYCYEQAGGNGDRRDGQNIFMPQTIQQDLLKFIERLAKAVKFVSVTWYGGEPLLGREIIFALTAKIIAVTEEYKLGYSAAMITNGYLLAKTPDIVAKLQAARINSLQITLDGPPAVHNRRRMLKGDGGPTFDAVLAGVKLLAASGLTVSLRINVDRGNMEEALPLLDILEANDLKDIHVDLGQVAADTAGCKSIESACTTMAEFSALNQTFRETLRQRGFKTGLTPFYPQIAQACGANRVNAFVVDPDGDLYKCWSEIGDKATSVGRLADFRQRGREERMREIRWLTWEPFEYADCAACKLLPICMGGCGFRAMFANGARPECGEWKYSLEHYVRARFCREKAIRQGGGKIAGPGG